MISRFIANCGNAQTASTPAQILPLFFLEEYKNNRNLKICNIFHDISCTGKLGLPYEIKAYSPNRHLITESWTPA